MNTGKHAALSDRVAVRTQAGFGAFVRGTRIRRGMTQEQLARAAGKSRRWLQDVEQGKVAPSLTAGMELAAALGYELFAERSHSSQVLDDVFGDLL